MTPEAAFQRLVGDLDYPIAIVTASAGGENTGCLVGFATQCSIAPPRYAVWISRKNHTLGVARQADALGVHFPSSDDLSLARLFGGETADEVDKFARCRWREGPRGVPLLEDCVRWFVGEVIGADPGRRPRRLRSRPDRGGVGRPVAGPARIPGDQGHPARHDA